MSRFQRERGTRTYFEGNITVVFEYPSRVFEYLVHMLGSQTLKVVHRGHEFVARVRLFLAQSAQASAGKTYKETVDIHCRSRSSALPCIFLPLYSEIISWYFYIFWVSNSSCID